MWCLQALARTGKQGEAAQVLKEGLKLTPVTADDEQAFLDLRQLQSEERL